jgi:hypothetical protein
VADALGVDYDETPIPGKDHIDFPFKTLDRAAIDKLVSAMPKEVFVKRAIGGLDHLDAKTAKVVMLRIATLKGSDFNAENVKKIIEEVEARAKMHESDFGRLEPAVGDGRQRVERTHSRSLPAHRLLAAHFRPFNPQY